MTKRSRLLQCILLANKNPNIRCCNVWGLPSSPSFFVTQVLLLQVYRKAPEAPRILNGRSQKFQCFAEKLIKTKKNVVWYFLPSFSASKGFRFLHCESKVCDGRHACSSQSKSTKITTNTKTAMLSNEQTNLIFICMFRFLSKHHI